MARYFPDTSDYLYLPSTPVTAEPMTICAWFYPDAALDDIQPIANVIDSGGSSYYGIQVRGHQLNDPFAAIERVNFSSSRWAEKQSVISQGNWYHGAGVFRATDYRQCYVDGIVGNSDTDDIGEPSSLDSIYIGADRDIGGFRYFKGGICEVAIWDADIGSTAIAAMAGGLSALYYPTGLVFYARLVSTEDYDEVGDNTLTVSGDLSTMAHPTINYPAGPPTNLICSVVSSVQINLSWTDNSSNEDGFAIERSDDGVSFSEIATVGANVTTYDDVGLTPNKKYYYRVRAYQVS